MAATRSSRSRRMNSSPPVKCTQLNCDQRSKKRPTSSGVISLTLFFCQMLHISQRKLQWYVATNVTLYGSDGERKLALRIEVARPSCRVSMSARRSGHRGSGSAPIAHPVREVLKRFVEARFLAVLQHVLKKPEDPPRAHGVLGAVKDEKSHDAVEVEDARTESIGVRDRLREVLVGAQSQKILVGQFGNAS